MLVFHSLRVLKAVRASLLVGCLGGVGSGLWLGAQESSGLPVSPDPGFERTMPVSSSIERVPVYFPPELPPLGAIASRRYGADILPPGRGMRSGSASVEAAAGDFVAEFFYPALALRISEGGGYRSVPESIERYRVTRDNLVRDLRAVLDQVRELPEPDREARLRVFAAEQKPALAALEASAEKERARWSYRDQAWGATRTGRVRIDDPMGFSTAELALLVRDVAYFQDGLDIWQRELLLEVARDVAVYGTPTALSENPGWLAFHPEPARILLPKLLPEALASRIARYESLKADVKRGLYETLLQTDRTFFAQQRARKLQGFFESQSGTLRALEVQADELRRELCRLPEMRQLVAPAASPLSPVLAEQLQTIVADTRKLRQVTASAVDGIRRRETAFLVSYRVTSTGLEYSVWPRNARRFPPASPPNPKVEAVKAELAGKAGDYERALQTLASRYQALRQAVMETLPNAPQAVGALLQNATLVALQHERVEAQQLYYQATLEPGLSTAQRRLLLGAAMVALDLELPSGLSQAMRK
ncbi:MAG: hypothetical protein JNJ82_13525 [Opitutaceae bacterium]|nr:hypothetical protein [Opitutaceae bacterium]